MISKDRKRFIFHLRWAEAIAEFPVDIQVEIIEAAARYATTGIVPELSPIAKGAFAFIRYDLENDGIECPDLPEEE